MIVKLWRKLKMIFLSSEKYGRSIGVKIGVNCNIKTSEFGSEPYLIEIGDHVQITHGVKFFNHGAAWVFRQEIPEFDVFGKIKIGNNVYVGNNVLIMPGITIGNNVIVGAGSIITKSIENDKIVAGNPARIVGEVENLKTRMAPYNMSCKGMSVKQKERFLLSQPEKRFLKK